MLKNEQNNIIPRNHNHRGGDVFLLDGTEGTRKITGQNAADGLLGLAGGVKKSELVDNDFKLGKIQGSPGGSWKRILEFVGPSIYSFQANSNAVTVSIRKQWSITAGEYHRVLLVTNNTKSFIKSLLDNGSTKQISAIRFYDMTQNSEGIIKKYCDILCSSSLNDPIDIILNDNLGYWKKTDVVDVEEDIQMFNKLEHTFKTNSWMDGPDSWPLT